MSKNRKKEHALDSPVEELRKMVAKGMTQGEAIDAMKRHGLPIIEAIKVTRELYCINLGAAKNGNSLVP